MKRILALLPLVLAVLLSAGPARAQAAPTPEDAARRYFEVMRRAEWDAAAKLMHPDALEQFKSFFTTLAAADSAAPVISTFFGVKTAAELRALPAAEVYARMIRSLAAMSPETKQALTSIQAEVIGSVPEGGDAAHVVYRMNVAVSGVSVAKVQVISFRRSGDRWLALLTGDLQGMIQSLSRAMTTRG